VVKFFLIGGKTMHKPGFSVGLVPLFPCGDRFLPGGYRVDNMSLQEKLNAMASIKDVKAVELSYPADFEDPKKMKEMLDKAGLAASNVEVELFGDIKWKYGALCSTDEKIRREAIELSKKAMEAAAGIGCDQISLWPGQDGFDYPFQADHKKQWENTITSVTEIAKYRPDIKVAIEYKIKEPRTHIQLGTIGKTLLMANTTGDNVGVMIDIGHGFMAYENVAESAIILNHYDKLYHLHLNDNFRYWDDDLIVGSVHLWETLELLYWLKKIDYKGWYSLDVFPYRENGLEVCRQSINNIKALMKILDKMDLKKIAELQKKNDAAAIIKILREEVLTGE
jgi:xylose isomerase